MPTIAGSSCCARRPSDPERRPLSAAAAGVHEVLVHFLLAWIRAEWDTPEFLCNDWSWLRRKRTRSRWTDARVLLRFLAADPVTWRGCPTQARLRIQISARAVRYAERFVSPAPIFAAQWWRTEQLASVLFASASALAVVFFAPDVLWGNVCTRRLSSNITDHFEVAITNLVLKARNGSPSDPEIMEIDHVMWFAGHILGSSLGWTQEKRLTGDYCQVCRYIGNVLSSNDHLGDESPLTSLRNGMLASGGCDELVDRVLSMEWDLDRPRTVDRVLGNFSDLLCLFKHLVAEWTPRFRCGPEHLQDFVRRYHEDIAFAVPTMDLRCSVFLLIYLVCRLPESEPTRAPLLAKLKGAGYGSNIYEPWYVPQDTGNDLVHPWRSVEWNCPQGKTDVRGPSEEDRVRTCRTTPTTRTPSSP